MSDRTHSNPQQTLRPGHPLLGDLPALREDPLAFLTHCAQEAGEKRVAALRLPLIRAFLLLDPGDIEQVLVTRHRDFVKPAWLHTPAVRRLLGDGLVTRDGEDWHRQRRVCQPAFAARLMDGYGQTIAALAKRTLQGWHTGDVRDLAHEMGILTLQVITETLLSADSLESANKISQAMDTLMQCFRSGYSFFGLLPLPPTPRERAAVRRLDRLVDDLIRAGCAAAGPTTLLSLLTTAAEDPEMTGQDPPQKYLREQVKTFLAAGYESSALTLTWVFLLLAQHPQVDTRLAAELQEVLGDRAPVPEDLSRLTYTQAVVQETWRLYPPLWMTGRTAVHRCEIGGQPVPAGSWLLTSQWVVQRLPRFFPDPDAFRPERWEGTETAGLPRFAYFPFGGGPRVCIGQRFAMMETVLLLAAIAQQFRMERTAGTDLQPWATMTLRPPVGIQMRLIRRSGTAAPGRAGLKDAESAGAGYNQPK